MQKLIINQLSKRFGDVQALQNIELALEPGKMLAVLGPSGCGKTTLLRAIAGFETPDAGQISIDGNIIFDAQSRIQPSNTKPINLKPINLKPINLKPEQRKIGYVPQHGVLFPHLTVEKNIGFGLSNTTKASQAARVNEMLKLVGMAGLGKRMPHQLSGGQQQRIALARALAPAPSLVLLDEPFSALDAGLRMALREEVKTTLNAIGATAIMVTHDQEEALSMADLVAVMRQGRCVQISDPVSLYKYPADLKVAKFVGEAVVLPARVVNGQIHSALGHLNLAAGCKEHIPTATIMIRPEQFLLTTSAEAQFSGYVLKTIYYGHDALVHLRIDDQWGGQEIQVRASGARSFAIGETLNLTVNGEVMAYE